MEDLIDHSGLFDKLDDAYTLSRNITYLEEGRYVKAGKLIAWSLLHGGPGIHCLAPECLAFLRGESPNLHLWIPHVMEERTSSMVTKVMAIYVAKIDFQINFRLIFKLISYQ